MRAFKSRLFYFSIVLLGFFIVQSCANIVPPSGGPKDITPPILMSANPKDSVLNKDIYQITLRFNKFMALHDLAKNMVTSPLLSRLPTVSVYGKKVDIKLPDSSLLPNTTYRLSFGNALTDNREQTPFKNYVYTFSTGNYFDSLRVNGIVLDAINGLPDTSASVFLYPADQNDSALLRGRPLYAQKVTSDGQFAFESLPQKKFKIFAISDKDHNYNYEPGVEKIDFYDSLVMPSAHPGNAISFAVFEEKKSDSTGTVIPEPTKGKDRFQSNRKRKELSKIAYRVLVDTTHKTAGTFDLAKPLEISLFKPLATIDSTKIYLSYDEKGIEVEALHSLRIDSAKILVRTQWQADKTYTLRLINGWAKDSSGQNLMPAKYSFHTKSLTDYATLNIHVDSAYVGRTFLLILSKDGKDVWKQAADNNKLVIPLLSSGDYTLHLILDTNENGLWDTGNLFEHKHAEKVIPYKGKILLKAGWVNDVDFKQSQSSALDKEDRFSNQK